MSGLPNVNKLIAQITAKAEALESEKLASAETIPEFSVPIAEGIYKLAAKVRETNLNSVSYSDVRDFARRLREHANV